MDFSMGLVKAYDGQGPVEIMTVIFTFPVREREQHGSVYTLSLVLTHQPVELAAE